MADLLRVYEPAECDKHGYPLAWSRCPTCHGYGWLAAGDNRPHPPGQCANPIVTATPDTDGFTATCCDSLNGCPDCHAQGSIKDLIRHLAEHRCERCGHPFMVGQSGEWERLTREYADPDPRLFEGVDEVPADRRHQQSINWSDCDFQCDHDGPCRLRVPGAAWEPVPDNLGPRDVLGGVQVQAAYRILTVHHLTGDWQNAQQAKRDCRWWNLAALCQRCHLEIQGKVKMQRPWPWEHSGWMKPHVAAFYAMKYQGRDLSREETMAELDLLLAMGQREESVERMAL